MDTTTATSREATSHADLGTWSEVPRTLPEQLALRAVRDGAPLRDVDWNGPTRQPFLDLQAQGWHKREHVLRGTTVTVTVHVWESPRGERQLPKVKSRAT